MKHLALPLALAVTACTAQSPKSAGVSSDDCFWPSRVSGFGDAGPDRAVVRIGTREMWELTLAPGCPDVNWALRIGIEARGGERICTGRPAQLLVPSASGTDLRRCLVSNVRRLSPEEVEARKAGS
jgi:hypothetical protein